MLTTCEEVTVPMTKPTEFVAIARSLQAECHRLNLVAPAFRSPPHQHGNRTVRRTPSGTVIVAVRLDRDPNLVAADLVDGVIAANPDLAGSDAEELIRSDLWIAAGLALAA
jgi:hypothetical protein